MFFQSLASPGPDGMHYTPITRFMGWVSTVYGDSSADPGSPLILCLGAPEFLVTPLTQPSTNNQLL